MRKTFYLILIFIYSILLISMVSCSNDKKLPKVNTDSPQSLLKSNPKADFFVIDNIVYTNATKVSWVNALTFTKGKLIGKIKNTNVKKNFSNWDATVLSINIEVFECKDRQDIVLVEINNKLIPYLEWVEG